MNAPKVTRTKIGQCGASLSCRYSVTVIAIVDIGSGAFLDSCWSFFGGVASMMWPARMLRTQAVKNVYNVHNNSFLV